MTVESALFFILSIKRFYYIYIVKDIFKNISLLILFLIPIFTTGQSKVDILKDSLKIASDTNKTNLYLQLSEEYFAQKNFKDAYVYFTKYSNLKDSLQSIELFLVKKRLKAQQINEHYQKEFDKLSESNSQQNIIISKLRIYKNILLVSSSLILFLLLFLFYDFRNKIKANRKLSEQNKQIREQNIEIKNQTIHLARANSELKKLSTVASKTDNSIIIASAKGNIEWVNEGFTRLLGYTLDEYIAAKGKTLIETSSNKDIVDIVENVLIDKKSQVYESEVISKEGIKYSMQTTLTPVLNENNEVVQLITIDTDISKLKNIEEELQKLLVTKDKFFSIIAHDLKNPFNSLIGLAQLLYHGYEKMNPEKVKYFHKNLYQISKNGYELLVNLLEWSRSQTGKIKFNPEKQNLYAITEETFSLYSTKAAQKEIAVNNVLSKDSYAIADKNMLKTIFRNIVANALKFTERGGAIEVSEEIDDSFVKITIKDTGVGISEEDLHKLFKLDKSHTTNGTENETGTGLGLILCKEFVEKHDGKIWIESKVGVGSKFIFTLPLKENPSN